MIPFFVLILTTLYFLRPASYSYSLSQQRTESANEIRTDFVDEEGRICFAADRGYATRIVQLEDGRWLAEQYLDEKGRAVDLPSGYAEVRYEYEEGFRTIRYLDKRGEPAVTSSGCDTIHRTLTAEGKDDTDTYFVAGEQVERKEGYWQCRRVYEGDSLCEQWYLDRDGEPVLNTLGYAMVRYQYSDAGRTEFYFDGEGQAVALSLGQYGVRYEGGVTTYLDAEGSPMNTIRGYAVIRAEGNRAFYFDKDGNPATMGNYQYGVEYVNGQTIYLDKDGNQMLRLDNFLHAHPGLVMLMGVLLTLLAVCLKGKVRLAFLAAYLLFIALMTLLFRESGDRQTALELFGSYRYFFTSPSKRQGILNNIWLFVPLGAALYAKRPLWFVPFLLSLAVELTQLAFGIGLFELDDIFNNSLGGLIGYGVAVALFRELPVESSTKQNPG